MKKIAAFALLGTLLCGSAQAYMNAPVISGGVGEEGRAAIEKIQSNYSVKTIFTGEGGIYLSDVDVQIVDRNGNVMVSNVSQGPMLLAALPPGRYILQAAADGYVKKQDFTVGRNGLKTLYVRFPVYDDNGGDYERNRSL